MAGQPAGLRCRQGLEADEPRGDRCGPLHGRAFDEAPGLAGRAPWQGGADHHERHEGTMPIGPGQSAIQGRSSQPALGLGYRGAQYVSIRYSERLAQAGIEPSVGSRGDSYDNALAETINGLYKAEVIHRRSWPTRESVELATLQWVSWFNHHRLLGPIGYIPPAEAEANYYRQLASQTSMVAA